MCKILAVLTFFARSFQTKIGCMYVKPQCFVNLTKNTHEKMALYLCSVRTNIVYDRGKNYKSNFGDQMLIGLLVSGLKFDLSIGVRSQI